MKCIMPKDIQMRFWIILLLVLLATNTFVYRALSAPDTLTVTVFEVGKGRATLVRTPSGKTILIDTGSDASILRALGTALPPWQRDIDVIILTSDKTASTGGLSNILARYHVSETIHIGTAATPYGSTFQFGSASITTLAPSQSTVTRGETLIAISSTTPTGTCAIDGKTRTSEACPGFSTLQWD